MIKLTRDRRYQVLSEDQKRSFGTYDTYEEAEERLREVEYFKHRDDKRPTGTARISSRDIRQRRAHRANEIREAVRNGSLDVLEEEYSANPGIGLEERIRNIAQRLEREYQGGRVPLPRIYGYLKDASKFDFEAAIFELEDEGRLELFVDDSKDPEEGAYDADRGLVWSVKPISPLAKSEAKSEAKAEDDEDDEDNENEEPIEAIKEAPKPAPVQAVKRPSKPRAPKPRAPKPKSPPVPSLETMGQGSVEPASDVSVSGGTGSVDSSEVAPEVTSDAAEVIAEPVIAKPTEMVVASPDSEPVLAIPEAEKPIDDNPAVVYIASLAPGSRRTMRESLRKIAQMLHGSIRTVPWARIRYQHTQAIRARLAERYAPSTANKMLFALKGTLRAAMRLGQMTADDYLRAVDIPTVRGARVRKGRMLSHEELRTMFGSIDPSTKSGARNAALLAVMVGTGLRRDEVSKLRLLDLKSGSLLVRGKGNKERLVPLANNVQVTLDRWLSVRGPTGEAIFEPVYDDRVHLKPLTDGGIAFILDKEIAAKAGIEHFSPHDLRRTFISSLLESGVDLATAQQLAGHSSPTTTAGYDRRGEQVKRDAVEKLSIPVGGI